jgi:hypothetical protein
MSPLLPWVFSIAFVTPNGEIKEYDAARFESKEVCVAFMNGTGWKRVQEETVGGRIIQRTCRKVHYEP